MIQLTYPWIGSRTNFKFEKYGGLCCCVLSFFELNLYLIATNFVLSYWRMSFDRKSMKGGEKRKEKKSEK